MVIFSIKKASLRLIRSNTDSRGLSNQFTSGIPGFTEKGDESSASHLGEAGFPGFDLVWRCVTEGRDGKYKKKNDARGVNRG
jgi:hypothetical protein